MRDLVFAICALILFYFAAKRSFIGVSIWLWSGLFVPVHWLYGFASSISYNSVFAVVTILGFFISRNKAKFHFDALFVLVILFFLHTTLTSATTVAIPALVWREWENFLKVIILLIFSCLIIRKEHHFNLYIWAIVLSIGFMGFVEGLKFIASAGGHKIKGPDGHILSDNNHMALALCMTLPMIAYLTSVTKEKVIVYGLKVMLVVCVIAILGTYSRGGMIGLVFVGGYFWLKSKHKIRLLFVLMIISSIAYTYLPERWYNRMDTIETASEDGSFMTRVNSWKIHTLMALDRPITGGGFKSCQYGYIWRSLAVNIDKLDFISTPPVSERGWAAHSIYFQVLGDHGFAGFFLFISIIALSFIKLTSIEKYYRKQTGVDDWRYRLSKMVKVSLLAYCVSGAALSLAYLELYYAILAVVICLAQRCKEDKKTQVVAV